jgi:transposase
MKKMHIIGVDVSKNKLDYHCYGHIITPAPVSNNVKGYRQMQKWITQKVSSDKTEVMLVMEHTGIYTFNIERFLEQHGWQYTKRPALDIKRSAGIHRGKNDKADARMISKYGWKNKEELQPSKPMSDTMVQLQQLMSYRDKLVAEKAGHQARLKELKTQMGNYLHDRIEQSAVYIIEVLSVEIESLEKEIKACIKKDEPLENNYNLLNSIRGVAFVTSVHMLISTENFTRFDNWRQYACYCGVAPFTHTSGSSIRGKTRVSHLANKKIKSLLTQAALTAIKYDEDLKNKYKQKRKEGKPLMCVINIIRAKLIERMFTVIKRQQPYILKPAA